MVENNAKTYRRSSLIDRAAKTCREFWTEQIFINGGLTSITDRTYTSWEFQERKIAYPSV